MPRTIDKNCSAANKARNNQAGHFLQIVCQDGHHRLWPRLLDASCLTIIIRDFPWVSSSERVGVEPLGHGFYRLTVYFGFMDRPDVSKALELCNQRGLALDTSQTWFLLSRATIIPTPGEGMAPWREQLFATIARNARTAGDYFNIPSGRVIELGTKIEI